MALSIPKQLYNALATLLLLPEDAKAEVADVFAKTTPTVGASLYDKKLRKIPALSRNEVPEIINLLISLNNIDELERDSSTVIDDLVTNLKERESERLKDIDDEQYEHLKEYLSKLLETKLLVLSAKALSVMTQHKYIYRSADVFSDVRGVFAKNKPNEKPQGAVIVHTLRLKTQTANSEEDFYVALDIEDLNALRRVLKRAADKHKSLRDSLSEDITYIGMESELYEDAS